MSRETFVFRCSLKPGALHAVKEAELSGKYKGRKYTAERTPDGKIYVAMLDESGRAGQWILVVKGVGKPIKAVEK